MGLTRHLVRGSTANLLDHALKIGAVFYLTPLMIQALGAEGYGAWLLAMNVLGYFLLLDLGVSFASIRQFAAALGAKDASRQTAILNVSRRFFRWIGLCIMVLTVAVLPLMPWIVSSSLPAADVMAPLAICGTMTAFRFFFRMPLIVLRARVRYDLMALFDGRTVVHLGLMTWVLKSNFGLLGVSVAQAASDSMELLFQVLLSRRLRDGEAQPVDVAEEKRTGRELFRYSRSIVMVNLGESLRLLVNPMLVGRLAGVAQVPVYSIGMRLITILEDVINALFGGQVLAAFSQLHGAGRMDALVLQFKRITALTAGFSAWAVMGVVCFGEAFFRRWLGTGFDASYQILLILAFPYALRFMQYPAHSLFYALNRQKWLVKLVFVGGMVSISLSLPLGMTYGVKGVVLGAAVETCLMYLVVMPWLVLQGHRHRACPLPAASGPVAGPVRRGGAVIVHAVGRPAACARLHGAGDLWGRILFGICRCLPLDGAGPRDEKHAV